MHNIKKKDTLNVSTSFSYLIFCPYVNLIREISTRINPFQKQTEILYTEMKCNAACECVTEPGIPVGLEVAFPLLAFRRAHF